jgi:hypothetical protein
VFCCIEIDAPAIWQIASAEPLCVLLQAATPTVYVSARIDAHDSAERITAVLINLREFTFLLSKVGNVDDLRLLEGRRENSAGVLLARPPSSDPLVFTGCYKLQSFLMANQTSGPKRPIITPQVTYDMASSFGCVITFASGFQFAAIGFETKTVLESRTDLS